MLIPRKDFFDEMFGINDMDSFCGRKENMPNKIKEAYVIISNRLCNNSFSKRPIELPNKIAIPWLKKEPKATPSKIIIGFVLLEKESTKSWVLSPNSETKTKKNAIINGYNNSINNQSSFSSYIYEKKIKLYLFVNSVWTYLHNKKRNVNMIK